MTNFSRRTFLSATAATAFVSMGASGRASLANDEIRVVVIGANGIGKTHLDGFSQMPGVRVVGVCDVDSAVVGKRVEEYSKKFGQTLKTYEDLRDVYDDPDVDAVVLAVPNHWHALGTVWGCQAGKDVYTEKPCSQNIWEAGQMQKAADKYGRIVQIGIQRRSFAHLRDFFKEVQRGEALGKVKRVKGFYMSRRTSIGKPKGRPVPPPTVNHDLWCGPAPTELVRAKYHYDWHWFWDYGNAELGNNGPHILDLCRWAIGAEEFPTAVTSIGGRFGWDDNGQTPNTHILHYDYATAPMTFEIRNLPSAAGKAENCQYMGIDNGIVIEGEHATYVGFDTGKVIDATGKTVREIIGDKGADSGRQLHRENFINAVRSRKADELNCGIRTGHVSSALCHLGNISHKLGAGVVVNELPERVQSQPLLAEAVKRMSEHLTANQINPASTVVSVGEALSIDPAQERFLQNPKANQLLSREYRAPFIVPEQV